MSQAADRSAGPTYLDYAASTPMRPEAIEAMLPYFAQHFANPSGSHRAARRARRAIDEARDRVAAAIGAQPNEVVFTGCGTESDNMAITGAVATSGPGAVAVCSRVEHPAVLDVVEHHDGEVVGVDAVGRIDPDALADALDRCAAAGRPVAVVSVMAVNNEVGTITDVAAVAAVVRRHAPGALVHTDAVQTPCWLDLRELIDHVDLLSLSGHKFGGPKGVGVLVERGGPKVAPLILGGGQERERRSGTHNVAGIVGFAEALAITDRDRAVEMARIASLRDSLVDGLAARVDGLVETVPRADKVAGSAHVCIPGVDSESLLFLLDQDDLCASAASACASGAMEPSHVLSAMGVDRSLAQGALRLTLGFASSAADVERGIEVIGASVEALRARRSALGTDS